MKQGTGSIIQLISKLIRNVTLDNRNQPLIRDWEWWQKIKIIWNHLTIKMWITSTLQYYDNLSVVVFSE